MKHPYHESVLGDVRDATAVTEAVAHVDGVIHLAGVLGTSEAISNPIPAAETNVLGGLNVLQACAQYKIPLVNIAVGTYFEDSTYPITKSAVEAFTRMYGKYRDTPVCSVRAFNAYGPMQSVAHPYGSSQVRKIIPSFIARALHGEPIEIYGDGSQIMDMIYITDVARCLVVALEKGPSGGVLYEAGTARPTTVKQIACLVGEEVTRQTGSGVTVRHLPMRPGESPGSQVLAEAGNVRKLGIDPGGFITLEDGLRDTVAYYRKLFAK